MSKVTVSVVLTTVGYTSGGSGTDAQIVRPYSRYSSCFDTMDALSLISNQKRGEPSFAPFLILVPYHHAVSLARYAD